MSALCNKYGCRSVCIAGAIIASAAFVLSTFSPTIGIMMLTYGVMGGVGFGMIYLPAVVAVGYYFEKKRSLATGIAVCGSGFGTFVFAPFANYLLNNFGSWKNANLVLAGVILNCAIFGALMRPLTYPKKKKDKPLMQRMAEERKMQMERGSITGSFFTVTMPDGTVKHVLKTPLNNEPGVHSSLALDQLAQQQMHPVATLPTITESKVQESRANGNGKLSPPEEEPTMDNLSVDNKNMPRNASQPVFSSPNSGERFAQSAKRNLANYLKFNCVIQAFQRMAPCHRSIAAAKHPSRAATSQRSAQSPMVRMYVLMKSEIR